MAITMLPISPAHAASETRSNPTFVFEGGGFGHSVGMSQFGAYGMALEGFSWEEIMSHYFTGASPATVHDDFTDELWVNLTLERTSLDLTVFSTNTSRNAKVKFTLGGDTVKAAVGDTVTITRTGSGCRLVAPRGTLEGSCVIDADWDGFDDTPSVGLQQSECHLVNWNDPAGSRLQPCQYARGAIRIRPDNNTATFNMSLEIEIEDYVLGISEMPYFWGSTGGMAALEAQAVAARSYALHRAIERGDPETRPWCSCHIYDTTLDQAYVGWGHGTQEWIDAVRATTGKVMTHPSETSNGRPLPIETFYSSSTFGWTEASEDGFLAYVPYLRPVDDHWSQLPEVGNHNARWTKRMTGSQIGSALGMGTVQSAEITACSTTGAALEITFRDGSGSKTYRTRDLRGKLALTSMQVFNIGSPTLGTPPCDGHGLPASEPSEGGPATLIAVDVDDDTTDDSVGNGDGAAQCGELVEVTTRVGTAGGRLDGITMQIVSDDPHVTVLWTPTSEADDVTAGSATFNDNDWDLQISSDAPDGHRAKLTLVVRAAQGSWELDVRIPVSCDAPSTGSIASIGDVDGNGSVDTAVVTTDADGDVRLVVEDTARGTVVSSTQIARSGHVPIDVEAIDGDVAVLLHDTDRNKTYVLLIDPASGSRLDSIPFGSRAEPLDLEVVPNVDRTAASELAVLVVKNRKPTAIVRDAGNGGKISTIKWSKRVTPIDLEVAPNVGSSDAPELVLLARHSNGRVFTYVSDVVTRTTISKVKFDRGTPAVDLEIVDNGDQALVVVSGTSSVGSARVAVRDARTGSTVVDRAVTDGRVVDSAVVVDTGGERTPDLAMLVVAPNGTVRAVVADPVTGRSLANTAFSQALDPVEVTVLSGTTVAALGLAGGVWTRATVRAS